MRNLLVKPININVLSTYKRVINLILIIALLVMAGKLWLKSDDEANSWLTSQSNQLGRSLAKLSAQNLAPYVAQKDNEQTNLQLSFIAADPHVIQASVYDNFGQPIGAFSPSKITSLYQNNDLPPLVFIEPIELSGEVLGYIRLLLSKHQVLAYHAEYQRKIFEQLQLIFVIAGIIGLIITRGFYRLRHNWSHNQETAVDN